MADLYPSGLTWIVYVYITFILPTYNVLSFKKKLNFEIQPNNVQTRNRLVYLLGVIPVQQGHWSTTHIMRRFNKTIV